MKNYNLKYLLMIIVIAFMSLESYAQEKEKDKNKMVTFEVRGNCGMCKARIEKAANQVKGVKYAKWDIPSKKMTLIYDEYKCTDVQIKEAIAKVGHDTEAMNAPDEIYNELPPCCKFRDPNSMLLDHH